MEFNAIVPVPASRVKAFGLNAAYLFTQLCYWAQRGGGSVRKNQKQIQEELGLSRHVIEASKKVLRDAGVLEFKSTGQACEYRPNKAASEKIEAEFMPRKSGRRSRDSGKRPAENREGLSTELPCFQAIPAIRGPEDIKIKDTAIHPQPVAALRSESELPQQHPLIETESVAKTPNRQQIVFGWLAKFTLLDSGARVGRVAKKLIEFGVTDDQMSKCAEYWQKKPWFKAGNRPNPEAVLAEWPRFLEWYEANKSNEVFYQSMSVDPKTFGYTDEQ